MERYTIYMFQENNDLKVAFPGVDWSCEPKLVKITNKHVLVYLKGRSYWNGTNSRGYAGAEYRLFRRRDPKPYGEYEIVEQQEKVSPGRQSTRIKQDLLAKMES